MPPSNILGFNHHSLEGAALGLDVFSDRKISSLKPEKYRENLPASIFVNKITFVLFLTWSLKTARPFRP